jgi:hypothetical protein
MVTNIGSDSNYSFYLKDQTPDYAIYGLTESPVKFQIAFPPKTDKQFEGNAEENSFGYVQGKHIMKVTLPPFPVTDGTDFQNMIKALQQWNEDNDLLDLYVKDDTGTGNIAVFKNSTDSLVQYHVRVIDARYENELGANQTIWTLTVKRYTS